MAATRKTGDAVRFTRMRTRLGLVWSGEAINLQESQSQAVLAISQRLMLY